MRLWRHARAFWAQRGHYAEAAALGPLALEAATVPPILRCGPGPLGPAYVRFYGGDVLAAGGRRAGLPAAVDAGDGSTAARSHHTLGSGLLMSDPERARRHLAESVELAHAAGDEWCEADAMQMQGFALLVQGAFTEATEVLEESVVLARRHRGAFQEGWHHSGLGIVALHRGDLDTAEAAFARAAAIGRDIGDPRWRVRTPHPGHGPGRAGPPPTSSPVAARAAALGRHLGPAEHRRASPPDDPALGHRVLAHDGAEVLDVHGEREHDRGTSS